MKVQRIHDAHGGCSHIEPPCDPDWSNLDKLRWKAAVIEHDNLLPEGTIQVNKNWTSFTIAADWCRTTFSAGTFTSAWHVLNGIDLGIRVKEAQ